MIWRETLAAVRELVVVLVGAIRARQLPFLAAAIAYYAFVSTVPLVVVGLALASFVGGDVLAGTVLLAMEGVLTEQAANLLSVALTSGAGREGATIVGLVVLLWSGLRVFRALDAAFSRIYGITEPESLGEQLHDASIVLGAIGLATVVSAGGMAAIPFKSLPLGSRLAPLASALVLPVAFLPLYYVFPDRPTTVRAALPGAIVAGLGWTVLASLFGVYASHAGSFQLYGLLGGVLLALTWFYAGAFVLLAGATLNAVLAGHAGDRQLQLQAPRRARHGDTMSDGASEGERRPDGGEPVESVDTREVDPEEVAELRRGLEELAADLEAKTRAREDLEADLRRYVRWRQRRGHARGWGPYLVLLYGTIMTLGAFFYLSGVWAVLAMIVIWLSTLGLYTLMVIVGLVGTAVGVPGRLAERVRNLR